MEPGHKTVLMSRRVAQRWLRAVSFPEYRFRVYYPIDQWHSLKGSLQGFRDGRVAFLGVPQIFDLGVKDMGEGMEIWSKDREGMQALVKWFEDRGYETTGI